MAAVQIVDGKVYGRELRQEMRDDRSLILEWNREHQSTQMFDNREQIYGCWSFLKENGMAPCFVVPRCPLVVDPEQEASLLCWYRGAELMDLPDPVGMAFGKQAFGLVQLLKPRCWVCRKLTWERCLTCNVAFYCSEACAKRDRKHPRFCQRPQRVRPHQDTSEKHLCVVCETPTEKYCGQCQRVKYCCVEHQRAHWSTHRAECKVWAQALEHKRRRERPAPPQQE